MKHRKRILQFLAVIVDSKNFRYRFFNLFVIVSCLVSRFLLHGSTIYIYMRNLAKLKRLEEKNFCSPNSMRFCVLYNDETEGRLCLSAKTMTMLAVVTVSVQNLAG